MVAAMGWQFQKYGWAEPVQREFVFPILRDDDAVAKDGAPSFVAVEAGNPAVSFFA
jgi:hypothetical protein